SDRDWSAVSTSMRKAAARGMVAAMAMTGMRRLTTSLGIVGKTPPEEILYTRAPEFLSRMRQPQRLAFLESVHWAYGALGGAVFGMLPGRARRMRLAGPVYGLLVWAGFEAGIAPALGLPRTSQPRPIERIALLSDHILYGLIVASAEEEHPADRAEVVAVDARPEPAVRMGESTATM
ncbi:MAG: hypothetical protein ACRDT8_01810, partial [Micromonosporaceae bacterium]